MRSVWTGTVAALLMLALPAIASGAPTCEEGPETVGETIVGTPCPDTIRAPRGITTVFGEGGNDTLYGGRGNDRLFGGGGNDRLYGGIGDDRPRGGPGDDLLSGGFGADSLDGETGADFIRGDATVDSIGDTGEDGAPDTLSFATGVTPGFPNQGSLFNYTGFPPYIAEEPGRGRGIYIDLEQGFANNGLAPAGGGVDRELEGTTFESFEVVIGTPFPDFIVGSDNAETIYGGGGVDVIHGEEGADELYGGAEGDSCTGDSDSTIECERDDTTVEPRAAGAIAVGLMAPAPAGPLALYMTGSSEDDEVTATYGSGAVTFELGGSSTGAFDPSQALQGGCAAPAGSKVTCPASVAPDSIVLAGLGGEDTLKATNFPETTSVILLGGEDRDVLSGGDTEDALVDGPGNDVVSAGGGDDAVPNNGGADNLAAGPGEDLFISNEICEGDTLDGGADRDNANWANFDTAIAIDMSAHTAGLIGPDGRPDCAGKPLSVLVGIEDVEGSDGNDILVGDDGPNQLLGRPGEDSYLAAGGDDSILANSGDSDPLIDCGDGWDTAQIDIPTHTATDDYEDAAPIACESVHERAPNSFRPPDTPPDPNPPPTSPPGDGSTTPVTDEPRKPRPKRPPRPDVKAPQTRIVAHPPALIKTVRRTRRVAFGFAANEAASSFRCRLDRGRFLPCRSPRTYRVRVGSHTIRVYAIDAAGNRDRTPAQFAFEVRRRR